MYPNARHVDSFTASLLNGGGRHRHTYVTIDEMPKVVAWFEEKLGPESRELDDKAVWQWRGPGRVVEEIWVSPFNADWEWVCRELVPEEVETLRTVITQEHHVLSRPWWQFWKGRS